MHRRDETMTSKGTAGFSLMRSHEIYASRGELVDSYSREQLS